MKGETNWGRKSDVLRSQVPFKPAPFLRIAGKLDEMHPVIVFSSFLGDGGEGGGGRTEEAICFAPYSVP